MHAPDSNALISRALLPAYQPAWLRVAAVVAFAIVVALSAVRVHRSLHDPAVSVKEPVGLIDFHHVVYLPAVAFRDGVNPYSAEYAANYPVNRQYPPYSPGMFVLNLPFAYLPLGVANVVYFALTVALTVALTTTALSVCRLPLSLVNVLGLATLVLISRPGHINLLLGQFTLPVVLGSIWALELARARPALAGVGLALATLKPTFGVPLVWLMFCRRDFRAVLFGVAIGGALVAAGLAPLVAKYGVAPVVASIRASESLHVADPVVDPETTWTRIDAQSLVGKLLPEGAPAGLEMAVTVACLLAAGIAVWRTSGTARGECVDSLSALIIASATLACIYHSTYDALFLVVPWVGVALGRLRDQMPRLVASAGLILLTVPAANYVSSKSVTDALGITGSLWTTVTAVNSLCIVLLLVLAISLALGPRQTKRI
jgi:hypothetical protein